MDEATRSQLNRSMAALAEGERGAFDAVYRTLSPVLTQLVATMSADRMIAEDITQQAMLKIMLRVSTFDRSKDALAWSMTIAANEYRSYRRKLGNRAASQLTASIEPINDDTPEEIAAQDELRAAARTVLGQLRPQDREVLVAAIYDGLRPPLAGAAAIRKRLQRALAHTRLIWKRLYGDDRHG